MHIEPWPATEWEEGRGGHVPVAVVLHTTVGSFASACGWFASAESHVSAHYLVGLDGRVARFVDEADTARHAGRVLRPTVQADAFADVLAGATNPNTVTVGVEFEDGGDPHGCARPDIQYLVGGELVASIAARWAIPLDRDHVVGHRELFAAKTCPGNLDVDRVVREARAWI